VQRLAEHRLERLIEAGRTLVSELDLERVLARLLEIACELTEAQYAALGILDPSKTNLERFITRGIDAPEHRRIGDLPRGRGVLGLLIRDPKPLRLADVGSHPESYGFPPAHPVMTSFLGVPVRVRGEVYGNLYLTEKAGAQQFSEEDEAAIVILADWAAIAIDNARLYQRAEDRREELERAVRGLEVTTAIARAVGGETDLDRVLELIVKRARALVEARGLMILLDEGETLTVAATAGEIPDQARGRRLTKAGTIAADVLASGAPERVASIGQSASAASKQIGFDASSALVVPLVFRGRTLGVLSAYDRLRNGPQFGREDEELMLSFAASAATAVHTARSVADERLRMALEGAEHERTRWARELHDETLQGLGSLQLLLSSALRQPDAERREAAVKETLSHVAHEIESLRNLITELRPAELDELGLESALESLAHRREAVTEMKVELEVDLGAGCGGAPRRLESQVESTIYRFVQEALSNVAKHAKAERVVVEVTAQPHAVEVTVRDNGRGFDTSVPSSGFGLVGMRERVALVGGRLDIGSSPAGTTLRAVLPVRDEAGGRAESVAV
jgi:signal transduction histidine kinase